MGMLLRLSIRAFKDLLFEGDIEFDFAVQHITIGWYWVYSSASEVYDLKIPLNLIFVKQRKK